MCVICVARRDVQVGCGVPACGGCGFSICLLTLAREMHIGDVSIQGLPGPRQRHEHIVLPLRGYIFVVHGLPQLSARHYQCAVRVIANGVLGQLPTIPLCPIAALLHLHPSFRSPLPRQPLSYSSDRLPSVEGMHGKRDVGSVHDVLFPIDL